MSNTGAALIERGWTYAGLCGTCHNKMKLWKKKGEEIKIASRLGYFYHYVGRHVVKSDYVTNLATYLQTIK